MFIDWLRGNLGNEGEFMYKEIHIVSTIIVVSVCVILAVIGSIKKISDKNKRIILNSIAIFQLSFEILWRAIYLFVFNTELNQLWPMYPCNLGGVLIPIIALLNNRTMKDMFYVFGFVGACLTFAMPEGIFCRDVMSFPILKSVLQHTGLLIIPSFEYASKMYRPTIKRYYLLVLGCMIHFINCELFDRLIGLNGDYMFYGSGLPFVIPGVSQYITLSVFALIVFYIIVFLLNIKDAIDHYKNQFRRKNNTNQE